MVRRVGDKIIITVRPPRIIAYINRLSISINDSEGHNYFFIRQNAETVFKSIHFNDTTKTDMRIPTGLYIWYITSAYPKFVISFLFENRRSRPEGDIRESYFARRRKRFCNYKVGFVLLVPFTHIFERNNIFEVTRRYNNNTVQKYIRLFERIARVRVNAYVRVIRLLLDYIEVN